MMIQEDYYLIIDFEATCCDDNSVPRDEMEIIEIGALLQSVGTLEVESEFQAFIKPVRNPKLTAFCTDLTSIQQTDVNHAPGFADTIHNMQEWLAPYDSYRFCSWGNYDKNQLQRDCHFHCVDYPFTNGHTNLKTETMSLLGIKKPLGLGTLLGRLNMEFEGTPHRGIDDARNIARIVRQLSGGGPL